MIELLAERATEEGEAFVRAGGEVMTYGSLVVAARAVVEALVAQLGPIERRVVGVAVADAAGALVASLGVLAGGGVLAPLQGGEVAARAARLGALGVVHADEGADALALEPVAGEPRELAREIALALPAAGGRVAMHDAAGLMSAVEGLAERLPLAGARVAVRHPFSTREGLLVALATLRAGATLVDARVEAPVLARLSADTLAGSPAGVAALAHGLQALDDAHRPSLRSILLSARPSPEERDAIVRAAPSARLYVHTGLAEALALAAVSEREPPYQSGSIGRPLRDMQVAEQAGALTVAGPSVARGWLDEGEPPVVAVAGRIDDEGYLFPG